MHFNYRWLHLTIRATQYQHPHSTQNLFERNLKPQPRPISIDRISIRNARPIAPNIHLCQTQVNCPRAVMAVAFREVCGPVFRVDVGPGTDEIVVTEGTDVDYAVWGV